jgi:hypothetical protein
MGYSFKVENTEACIEISNLRLLDNDSCHVTFDVCFSQFDYAHKINFSEMLVYRLKMDKYIFDENHTYKQLHFEPNSICLKILPQYDDFFEFELTYRIKLEKHIVDEFLIVFNAYLDLLAEEGVER